MEFIHFIDKSASNNIKSEGIKTQNNYHVYGILIYPLVKIDFKAPNSDYILEEKSINSNLSVEERWEIIGALGLRQKNKKVYGAIFNLSSKFWPITVHIDLDSSISKKFAKEFNTLNSNLVIYDFEKNLFEVVDSFTDDNYVLETKFKVMSEIGLKSLLECFTKSGGGIWGALSIYCLITKNIEERTIKKIISF